jgi:molybdopterin-containing oxidoreductase family iron-sulfur binding subunit
MVRNGDGSFEDISWEDATRRVVERLSAVSGERIWFVTGHETASFDALIDEWLAAVGSDNRVVHEPFAYEAMHHANRDVFGINTPLRCNFSAAKYVLSFGVDFLETWGSPVEQTREFSLGHSYQAGEMGRYVHIEPRMSMSAMTADEWIAPLPGTEGLLALGIAHVIVRDRLASLPADVSRLRGLLDSHDASSVAAATGVSVEKIENLAQEFTAHPSVAIAGGVGTQHDAAHGTAAAANILNYVAGNVGRTVEFLPDDDSSGAGSYSDTVALVQAMRSGQVELLLVHGANPAYSTPAGLGFSEAMVGATYKVSFARFFDETTMQCDLILPDHDPLEQWNDQKSSPGVYALQQPVMQPVFNTRQTGDVLLALAAQMEGRAAQAFESETYKEYVQQRWVGLQRQLREPGTFQAFWDNALQHGGVWSEVRTQQVRLAPSSAWVDVSAWTSPGGNSLTLVAYPTSVLFDGRGANRPWLQELPDPVTKIAWGSWVEINPLTAERLGIREGEFVEVTSDHGTVTVPAYPYAGIREDTVAIPIGQGHTAFGRYAESRGASVYELLAADATQFGGVSYYTSVTLRNTGEWERLAKTEGNNRQMGRGIAQATTLSALEHPEDHGEEHHVEHAAPVPEHIEEIIEEVQEAQHDEWKQRGGYAVEDLPRWAMAIDLSKCTGCSACVTACYAENNIPTVGPELIRRGREMSWMRIERYFEDHEHGAVEARFLPMICQHCTNAPCEPVCPVFAAYHTPDGLNAQVYNRCVGTRYCSNNCPYKVRYFNWFDHQNENDAAYSWPDPFHWLLNPDVTVRAKGVMEKCTFCVQRIRDKQHQSKLSGEPLIDGDVVTACQQTCPADAIVFGDINDPESRIRALAEDGRGYHVLEGLNTLPAVTYLKKVRNVAEAEE